MKVIAVQFKEMGRVIAERHIPPLIANNLEENLFQSEIRALYHRLVERLSPFGEEGDYYGISDYGIRPDLRDRPTVSAPPATHTRQFVITILTERFYRSDFWGVLHEFLCAEAPSYRIWIGKDFDQTWALDIVLTADKAWIFCDNEAEKNRLIETLNGL